MNFQVFAGHSRTEKKKTGKNSLTTDNSCKSKQSNETSKDHKGDDKELKANAICKESLFNLSEVN
jgi:hypothetical protein